MIPGSAPPKSRITKSNTMSNATGKTVLGHSNTDKRRSAIEGSKLSDSNEKTNVIDESLQR